MTQGKTVLLLGAYGLAGQAILRALVYRGLSVAAAGRNEQKLLFVIEAVKAEFPESQVRPAVFDLQDEGALKSSTHYTDKASEQEHYRRLKRLSPSAASARVFLGVALGLYPGISGILARQLLVRLEEPAGANIYLAMGPNREGGGRAQRLTGVLELTTRLQELLTRLLSPQKRRCARESLVSVAERTCAAPRPIPRSIRSGAVGYSLERRPPRFGVGLFERYGTRDSGTTRPGRGTADIRGRSCSTANRDPICSGVLLAGRCGRGAGGRQREI